MRIPVGNFGNAIPDAAPRVNIPRGAFSKGQGLEQLGNTGMNVAAQMMEDQRALNRARSANDFQDYRIAEQGLRTNIDTALADGSLSSADAPDAYKSGLADIPKPNASFADPVTAENVSRGIGQVQAEGAQKLQHSIIGAVAIEQKAELKRGMWQINQLAGAVGADPAKEIAQINAFDAEGMQIYGAEWPTIKQEWTAQTWFDVAASNIERSSGSITALQAIQADLKDPKGSYADKLDTKANTALRIKVEQQIQGAIIDANNARVIAEREKAQQQDQIMQGYLARTVAGKLTVGEVLKNKDLTFQQQLHMKSIIEAQANKADVTDNRVFINTFNRIHAAPGAKDAITSPDQLYPLVGHGLSITDMARLRAEVEGKNQPEGEMLKNFKKMAQDQIDASTLFGKDQVGAENFYKWNVYFDQQFAEQRKAGKSPHDLLDPTSKDYLGKTISGFTRTLAQQTADMAATMGGKPAALLTPLKNSKGWTLQTDAKGNKAYVSPDGKQFETVK